MSSIASIAAVGQKHITPVIPTQEKSCLPSVNFSSVNASIWYLKPIFTNTFCHGIDSKLPPPLQNFFLLGTLAPKLEVSTKTTVEETLCDVNSEAEVANPKFVLCACQPQQRKGRPTRVCHSVGYSRNQKKNPAKEKKSRPKFLYRKVEDDLILRNNPNITKCYDSEPVAETPLLHCYCNLRSRSMESIPRQSKFLGRRTSPEDIHRNSNRGCHCNDCPICLMYEGYFSNCSRLKNCADDCLCPNSHKLVNVDPCCRQDAKFCVRPRNGSLHGSDISNDSYERVCFCLPERPRGLAERLHKKLVKTLDSNRRFLENYAVCQNVS